MLSLRFSFWPRALRSRHHQLRSNIGLRLMRPNRKNTPRRSNHLTRMDRFSHQLHLHRWSLLHLRPRLHHRRRWQREIIRTESLFPANRIWSRARILLVNILMWKGSLRAPKSRIPTPTRFSLCRKASGPGVVRCGDSEYGLPQHSHSIQLCGMNISEFRSLLWSCA